MKFKYIGSSGQKDMDLGLYGLKKPTEILLKDEIIDVPDSEKDLINRLKINGNYELYLESKKFNKPKKEEKEEKTKKEKEEK